MFTTCPIFVDHGANRCWICPRIGILNFTIEYSFFHIWLQCLVFTWKHTGQHDVKMGRPSPGDLLNSTYTCSSKHTAPPHVWYVVDPQFYTTTILDGTNGRWCKWKELASLNHEVSGSKPMRMEKTMLGELSPARAWPGSNRINRNP